MSLFRSTLGQGTGRLSTGESAPRETDTEWREAGVDPGADTWGRSCIGRGPFTLLSCSETFTHVVLFAHFSVCSILLTVT